MADKFTKRAKELWRSLARRQEARNEGMDREKVIVLVISLFLAFCLWLIVNLNRDYSLELELPVQLGNLTTDLALAEELPDEVTASLSGNGWNLISMYNNPPQIYVNVSKEEVNLFEQVRQQVGDVSNVTVETVDPLYMQISLEPKQSKKVPVKLNTQVQFASQYGFLQEPEITPDSITIHGAASQIENINSWPTDSLTFKNIDESFSREIDLKASSPLITLSDTRIKYQAEVAEFTEGGVTLPVETRDFPAGQVVSFSPSSVEVKYRVPLQKYAEFENSKSFVVYVTYAQIQHDTTGYVVPQIEKVQDKAYLKVRSVQPRQVAYFTIIQN